VLCQLSYSHRRLHYSNFDDSNCASPMSETRSPNACNSESGRYSDSRIADAHYQRIAVPRCSQLMQVGYGLISNTVPQPLPTPSVHNRWCTIAKV
jgi:hypothetical protein